MTGSEPDFVRTWLGKSGFPLEFEAARAFRQAGFDVHQGLHYRADQLQAEAARELDVVAVREQFVGQHPPTRCTIMFVVECKTSDTPWIVFRTPSTESLWGALGRFPMKVIAEENVLRGLEENEHPWLLHLPANVGFRLSAVGDRGDGQGKRSQPSERDRGFRAIKQVGDAATGMLREGVRLPTLAIPVLVLDSHLYSATDADEGGEIAPSKWERILWRGHLSGEPMAVDVVTREFVSEYASKAADGAAQFLPIMRAAALDARYESMHREDPPGLLDRAIMAVEWMADTTRAIAASAQRHLLRRPR